MKKDSVQEEEKSGRNIYLRDGQWDQLDRLKEEKGVSRNKVIRNLIDKALTEVDSQ